MNLLTALPGGDPDQATDASLARALQRGLPGAAAATWERFYPLVHRTLARTLGSDDEVNDLAQDVFMRLFARVRVLRDPEALRSFVYSITVRVIRGELRRRWVRRIMKPMSDYADLSNRLIAPVAPSEERAALVRFYRLLETLNSRERTAYVLRHLEEMNLEETAAAMEVSLATIKRILARANARMNDVLRADPVLSGYFPDGANPKGVSRA
ncbi:MAG: sigma-70 family RNA polymerase sigma factor [Deltaproteobacteria bacterium]|nr:sigma-70 family RNA polymerase sigma factor [Deltaproteobacteria bacterium]